jgi:hypothetical protein
MKTNKIIWIMIACCLWLQIPANGQIIGQGEAQKKNLLDQIAALEVYKGYLQKGYSVAKDGTGTISTIKNGDLNLHAAYYDSLSVVSSKVRNYPKVRATITLQKQIVSGHDKAVPKIAGSRLSATEKNGYNTIYQAILKRSVTDLEELQLIVADGKLKLSDDERLTHIDKLYKTMLNNYGQAQKLNNQTLALAAQREREGKDNKALKSLYGL